MARPVVSRMVHGKSFQPVHLNSIDFTTWGSFEKQMLENVCFNKGYVSPRPC
jgi:hypothetical protein